jgi:hypothetical protein
LGNATRLRHNGTTGKSRMACMHELTVVQALDYFNPLPQHAIEPVNSVDRMREEADCDVMDWHAVLRRAATE